MLKNTCPILALVFSITLIISVLSSVNFGVADSSKTWTVDCHGSADFTSITDAVNFAKAGDTIYVKNGTYNGTVFIIKGSVNFMGDKSPC